MVWEGAMGSGVGRMGLTETWRLVSEQGSVARLG